MAKPHLEALLEGTEIRLCVINACFKPYWITRPIQNPGERVWTSLDKKVEGNCRLRFRVPPVSLEENNAPYHAESEV